MSRSARNVLQTCLAIGAVCVLGAFVVAKVGGRPVYTVDDAYITIHNARVLHQGHDPNFPGVSALEAATSLVHLALVWLASFAMQPRWAVYLVAWLAIGASLAGLLGICRALSLGRAATAMLLALAVISGRPTELVLNGLETGLAFAVATWMIALALRPDTVSHRVDALLGGIAPFVRPELGVLALALAVVRWHSAVVRDRKTAMRSIASDIATLTLGAAPWAIWSLVATGSVVPHTASIKTVWFAESCRALSDRFALFSRVLAEVGTVFGTIVLASVALAFHPVGRACLAFVAAVLGLYFLRLPGGLAHNDNRYALVLQPVFLFAVALTLAATARERTRRVGWALAIVSCLASLATLPSKWTKFLERRADARERNELAHFALRALPRDATVLVHDVGYLSAATPFVMVDLVGLKSPDAAAIERAITGPSCGALRGDAIAEIASRRHATHLVSLRAWDVQFGISAALVRHGWTLRTLRERSHGYDVYALTAPSATAPRE